MEGKIYIIGAILFGLAYPLLKSLVGGTWVVVIAVAYFGLLRLLGHYAAKQTLRKFGTTPGNQK